MKYDLASIAHLDELATFDEIIDVRSPGEFAEDHIPGAINCPVLDDAQRVEVGTLYKQVSPFAAKKIGAAHVAANIARHLRDRFLERPHTWRPLIVCWRGGQRSGSMTYIFRRIGWEAQQLAGGYKTYRHLVVGTLAERPSTLRLRVICGATGSGKSRVLQALARLGAQTLDLEDLACHKGSVLGARRDRPQPSQKMFESRLVSALRTLDPRQPVYVEAESRKIGSLHVPGALIETMRAADCVNIHASFDARVDFLLRDYDYLPSAPGWLIERLQTLDRLYTPDVLRRWRDRAAEGQWRELVQELLVMHYDPLYKRSQSHNYIGYRSSLTLCTDDLTPAGIDDLARRVLTAWP
ncbi:MAG TPA: tRNA 2-selenouridine(34) synthase MnmH [Accumulibacter sp.]|jgi:tRNA 2-selenouridine synthase|nr:tRNA 2-selenouridine(34) synthase MnmH [Accumulibacter sp.]